MTIHEVKRRSIKDNQKLFLHLLKENNVAKFQELLAQHPEYIQMRCSVDDDEVSF